MAPLEATEDCDEVDGDEAEDEPRWAAALAAGGTGDDMRDDAAAVPVASLPLADALGAVDGDETLAAAGLALLARALRE